MKLRRKILYALGTVLWIVVLCLSLEVFAFLQWRWIESRNPLAKAYSSGTSVWPRVDIDASGVASAEQLKLITETEGLSETKPGGFPEDHLGTLFAALTEDERKTYVSLNSAAIVVYDRDGRNLGTYASQDSLGGMGWNASELAQKPFTETPLATATGEGIQLIQRVFDTGKPETIAYKIPAQSGTHEVEATCYPMRTPTGEVCAVATCWKNITGLGLTETIARTQDIESNPMWKQLWFEYRKNAHLSKIWRSNNVGFRSEDIVLPKPQGVFRIICMGGSTTEEGLTNDLTYPKLLQNKLRERFGENPRIEVVNCGVVGLDLMNERKRALDYARLEPDLAIDYNAVNDICHGIFPKLEGMMPKWRRVLGRSRFIERYCNRLLWPGDEEFLKEIDSMMLSNLRTIMDVLGQRGASMAICGFAYPEPGKLRRVERDYFEYNVKNFWQGRYFTFGTYCRLVDMYNAQTRALCASKGLLYIPLEQELQGTSREFGDICHLRPRGIERKVEIISRYLIPHLEKLFAERGAQKGAGK